MTLERDVRIPRDPERFKRFVEEFTEAFRRLYDFFRRHRDGQRYNGERRQQDGQRPYGERRQQNGQRPVPLPFPFPTNGMQQFDGMVPTVPEVQRLPIIDLDELGDYIRPFVRDLKFIIIFLVFVVVGSTFLSERAMFYILALIFLGMLVVNAEKVRNLLAYIPW